MKIIEKFIKGKREDQSLCEDGIFISDDFVAVVDGVTSKGNQKWQKRLSSGGYGKNVILSALENMKKDATVTELFDTLDSALFKAYSAEVVNDNRDEYLRACIAVYSRHFNEVWVLGDCQCMINGINHQPTGGVDELMAMLRAFVIESAMVTQGLEEDSLYTNDIGREAVLPFIRKQTAFENNEHSEFGYGVLNGHGAPHRLVKSYPVKQGETVVLASDGYPSLCDTLEKSEKELSRLLKEDPLCYRQNRCTKGIAKGNDSFDDRTYIKFEV